MCTYLNLSPGFFLPPLLSVSISLYVSPIYISLALSFSLYLSFPFYPSLFLSVFLFRSQSWSVFLSYHLFVNWGVFCHVGFKAVNWFLLCNILIHQFSILNRHPFSISNNQFVPGALLAANCAPFMRISSGVRGVVVVHIDIQRGRVRWCPKREQNTGICCQYMSQ